MSNISPLTLVNPYFNARMEAAKWNPRLTNREDVSELLYIDAKTLGGYESGKATPPPDIVALMTEIYRCPELLNNYCARECPLGKGRVQLLQDIPVERIALRLNRSCRDVQSVLYDLEDILADGKVNEEEREQLHGILNRLDEIVTAAGELKLWAEKAQLQLQRI